ncbi:hypothetical protein A2V54_00105 [candidate division WWE3 bacterium RBG_19FT_COMBO_53_11]|uniref:DUF4012 domain-containing protein n=1 Tax=candidate division WWE3 bacterium RBG_19FT_COMBO_53_11 TaxID=1802613 RepID=A0A1F4UHZ8_UNCKA|nr:MAG: hypothetical protein A2155_02770 [candidate division WWE3 bacterium RBG_16_52_45]OGC44598.1 MAG: hypothetical protein A2V54_00105 [candidate division WWE3 bacterium RBG_19FT_COMBO_53_11]
MELLDQSSRKKSPPHDLLPAVPFRKRLLGKKRRWVALGILLVLLLSVALPAGALVYLFFQVREFPALGNELNGAITSQDLPRIEASLGAIDSQLKKAETAFSSMFVLRLIPWVGDYYRDGIHALKAARLAVDTGEEIAAVLGPYKENLGLGPGFGSQITVEQRLQNLLDTLPPLADKLDLVWTNIPLIKEELQGINSFRYPEDFRGIKVRFWLSEAQKILDEVEPLVLRGREILEIAPALLGSPKRTYLVLFQNAAELRPTGGFITGFSLLTVNGGRVTANDFHSGAYFADNYPPELGVAPPPVMKYLNVYKWHFQDSNFSPDFPTTAKTILGAWKKSPLPKVSGVVAINTQIAADLLNLTGPVRISGYDLDLANTGLPEDCRQGGQNFTSVNLICRLEFYVEKSPPGSSGTEARKKILDLVSDAVIKKISNSSAEIWPKLVDFVFKHLQQKNLMIFSSAENEQKFVSDLGYAGEVRDASNDYLYINDSNFGGLKTNLYLKEEVEQSLQKLEDGTWRKTVDIKYRNPVPFDGWLSGYYKDFVRIYVPQGTKLVSVSGALQIWTNRDQWSTTIQNAAGWGEFGKTVFGAYFAVLPQRDYTLTFVYDLPSSVSKAIDDSGEYRLLLQKQSGTNIGLVKVQIGDTMESVNLSQDREITLTLGR